MSEDLNIPSVPVAFRTLVANGFVPDGARAGDRCRKLHFTYRERFGGLTRYTFAICTEELDPAEVKVLRKEGKERRSVVIVVNGGTFGELTCIDWQTFLGKLGGPLDSSLCYEPEFGDRLRELAWNRLPAGLAGAANDLFEDHVYAALQFLLAGRVTRYGNDERGKALPDGMWHAYGQPVVLYDAKAREKSFSLGTEAQRQFADYVKHFKQRYGNSIGEVFSFLVISSKFSGDRAGTSAELYKECRVKLTCMTADNLESIVNLIKARPIARSAIDWFNIFSRDEVTESLIEGELRKIKEERVLEELDGHIG